MSYSIMCPLISAATRQEDDESEDEEQQPDLAMHLSLGNGPTTPLQQHESNIVEEEYPLLLDSPPLSPIRLDRDTPGRTGER